MEEVGGNKSSVRDVEGPKKLLEELFKIPLFEDKEKCPWAFVACYAIESYK